MNNRFGELLSNRLHFAADMNFDGAVTISDIGLWFKWLFFMPGDLLLLTLLDTSMGNFFEVTFYSIQGVASGFLSFFGWIVIMVFIAANVMQGGQP